MFRSILSFLNQRFGYCALLPLIIYFFHSLFFRHWIVDDAAISFVYSRNLAHGFGLVAQPGVPPVEGYSNFTWVVLMAPFFALSSFDPLWTPKIISFLLVSATFILWFVRLGRYASGADKIAILWAFCFLALIPSFVIWTCSGLENPLYLFIVSALFWQTHHLLTTDESSRPNPSRNLVGRSVIWGGILAALVAMTRPDGVVYSVAFPVLLAFAAPALRRSTAGYFHPLRVLGLYALGFIFVYGAFLGFRHFYFGEWVPNTYYAKGGPGKEQILGILLLSPSMLFKFSTLQSSAVGFLQIGVWFLFAGGIWAAYRAGLWRLEHSAIVVFGLLATLSFLLLPTDWMSEKRFATSFYLFFALALGYSIRFFCVLFPLNRISQRWSGMAIAAIFTLLLVPQFYGRSLAFAREPTISFESVKLNMGDRFNRYANELGISHGSLLVADAGGTLFVSKLRVYDLGMLVDKTIAHTLNKNPPAFYDYVFEKARPTFIHLHEYFAYLAHLDTDPRFRRDYVAIHEYRDPEDKKKFGVSVLSGDFVRKDALRGHPIPCP